jgi:hypothetical protein
MWKILKPGDKVSVGDNLRYRSNSNTQQPEAEVYEVVRTDQHYFEIVRQTEKDKVSEPPDRKAVRYTDIGYNVLLERRSDPETN